jgi:hypothetical protein
MMSDPFPVMVLIIGIITAIAFIEALILLLPLRIVLSFHTSRTVTKTVLVASWFIFGIEMQVSEKGPQLAVMACRVKLMTWPLSGFTAPGKEPAQGFGQGQVPGIISSLLRLQGPFLDLLLDMFRHTRLDYARGTARIGLGDPSATGMMYGLYRAVIALFPTNRINLTIIPEFNEEICEIDIRTRFRVIYPLRVLVNTLKIVKHPVARNVMKIVRSKNPGDVTV